MQIAFHIGANCTDEDRLLKSLLKNADVLLKQGISVPGPSRYRTLLREAIQGLKGAAPPADARDILLDTIVENDHVDRVVLSNGNFICIPNRIFDNGVFYSQATAKIDGLRQLFPNDDVSLFMGIRNPATFLQETFARSKTDQLVDYLGAVRPEEIRWSDVIRRIKKAAPEAPLTVWCNEDTPLLWEQLLRRIAGVNAQVELTGKDDMLARTVTREGIKAFRHALAKDPPRSQAEKHNRIAALWDEHARPEQLEDEINLPGLTPETIQTMIDSYDDDLAQIAHMPGVKLVMPVG
ncbi:hypothetical protein [Yoonia sp. SS1-5]|uniref:Sulfotransferase n=1 Tax=Yoonia rhodophyticola TaxID=3137370 RepID=A0AAN0M914_9RHOB